MTSCPQNSSSSHPRLLPTPPDTHKPEAPLCTGRGAEGGGPRRERGYCQLAKGSSLHPEVGNGTTGLVGVSVAQAELCPQADRRAAFMPSQCWSRTNTADLGCCLPSTNCLLAPSLGMGPALDANAPTGNCLLPRACTPG